MKPIRLVCALALALAGGLVMASPASAGGWAATVLDPLPERIEAARTYTIGYWVLQHATHPYNGRMNESGELGRTGLRIVSEDGDVRTFDGVRLGQPAHFSAAVVVPHPGTWEVYAIQGVFDQYKIGTLEIPGKLQVEPLPPPVHGDDYEWGPTGPPEVVHEGQHGASTSDGQSRGDGRDGNDDRGTAAAANRRPDQGTGPSPSIGVSSSPLPVATITAGSAGLAAIGGILFLTRGRIAAAFRWPGRAGRK